MYYMNSTIQITGCQVGFLANIGRSLPVGRRGRYARMRNSVFELGGILRGHRNVSDTLLHLYEVLDAAFGPQHWWPGEARDETIVGAVLTQNTAWRNVERAIDRLKSANVLTLEVMRTLDEADLAELIRPAGTYRVKARRLKALVLWIYDRCDGDLDTLFAEDPATLRAGLLGVPGVGPETADAIMLYAGSIPTFVVDAYTLRVLRRHFVIDDAARYDDTQALFHRHLDRDADMFGQYHALFVELGKRFCSPRAACDACPLRDWPRDASL